mmetsp:Transcript_6982/g.25221  ORF Transcript_6982/g.25221 Transcript_6982/m.25221 type:complete len:380 (-) Transcript_6982:3530-4669(-)
MADLSLEVPLGVAVVPAAKEDAAVQHHPLAAVHRKGHLACPGLLLRLGQEVGAAQDAIHEDGVAVAAIWPRCDRKHVPLAVLQVNVAGGISGIVVGDEPVAVQISLAPLALVLIRGVLENDTGHAVGGVGDFGQVNVELVRVPGAEGHTVVLGVGVNVLESPAEAWLGLPDPKVDRKAAPLCIGDWVKGHEGVVRGVACQHLSKGAIILHPVRSLVPPGVQPRGPRVRLSLCQREEGQRRRDVHERVGEKHGPAVGIELGKRHGVRRHRDALPVEGLRVARVHTLAHLSGRVCLWRADGPVLTELAGEGVLVHSLLGVVRPAPDVASLPDLGPVQAPERIGCIRQLALGNLAHQQLHRPLKGSRLARASDVKVHDLVPL